MKTGTRSERALWLSTHIGFLKGSAKPCAPITASPGLPDLSRYGAESRLTREHALNVNGRVIIEDGRWRLSKAGRQRMRASLEGAIRERD